MFRVATFKIAKTWKQPKCPLTHEWTNKMWSTHTHTRTHPGGTSCKEPAH